MKSLGRRRRCSGVAVRLFTIHKVRRFHKSILAGLSRGKSEKTKKNKNCSENKTVRPAERRVKCGSWSGGGGGGGGCDGVGRRHDESFAGN